MALGCRFGPTLAISLVLFCAAGLTGGHEEHDPNYWNHQAHELLFEKKDYTMQKINIAKNIMVFVGAGMSPATVTAARTFAGAENETFAFEKMKWSGNARTYCVDSRVPDSACAGTAFLTGVKSNLGTVAMHPTVKRGDCVATSDKVKQLESIAKWALDAGKVVGFATTSRVTAGSSAALYGHSADARWENDAEKTKTGKHEGINSNVCQLYLFQGELAALDTSKIDHLLGLFDYDQLPYAADVGNGQNPDTPPLVRMVHYSLEMLQKKEHSNGFLLFVEDGNILRAHQENKPNKAFQQVAHYSMAFDMGHMMVSETNSLVVSLNDVGSTLSLPGYPARDTDALVSAGTSDQDSKPYLSVSYATGPGFDSYYKLPEGRLDPVTVLQNAATPAKERTCSASVPMTAGVNGGEDAMVYASGPWAFMLSGAYEQNFVAHAITFASCITDVCGGASSVVLSAATVLLAIVVKLFA
ncbi:alkaline phosphatase, tissue-nonspecific isozyme-like [Culex pipiens pallens]|uniref:alkaline phosphatase, tissue-nonspecific isozyme-like n=1 Tax=Culex pipiens pallens TaxID=42434 RepID=UPI0019536CD0|nr:alkaline phosphatase, tissue-nonspecific isozyme-like [Culex pipiens pallens]